MTIDWSSVPWPGWSLAVACVLAATTLSRCVAPRFRPSPLLAVAMAVVLRPWSRAAMLPVAALSAFALFMLMVWPRLFSARYK